MVSHLTVSPFFIPIIHTCCICKRMFRKLLVLISDRILLFLILCMITEKESEIAKN